MVSLVATNARRVAVFNKQLSQERTKDTLPKLSFGGRRGGVIIRVRVMLGLSEKSGKSRASGTRTETQRRGKEESLSPCGFATRSHVLSRLASLASQYEALAYRP